VLIPEASLTSPGPSCPSCRTRSAPSPLYDHHLPISDTNPLYHSFCSQEYSLMTFPSHLRPSSYSSTQEQEGGEVNATYRTDRHSTPTSVKYNISTTPFLPGFTLLKQGHNREATAPSCRPLASRNNSVLQPGGSLLAHKQGKEDITQRQGKTRRQRRGKWEGAGAEALPGEAAYRAAGVYTTSLGRRHNFFTQTNKSLSRFFNKFLKL
jgi:hypothetical protein